MNVPRHSLAQRARPIVQGNLRFGLEQVIVRISRAVSQIVRFSGSIERHLVLDVVNLTNPEIVKDVGARETLDFADVSRVTSAE
jgi:hypothetical protein